MMKIEYKPGSLLSTAVSLQKVKAQQVTTKHKHTLRSSGGFWRHDEWAGEGLNGKEEEIRDELIHIERSQCQTLVLSRTQIVVCVVCETMQKTQSHILCDLI